MSVEGESPASALLDLSSAEVGSLLFPHLTVFWLMTVFDNTKGYSWKTNQFGLTIDTVVSFELVLTNGTIKTVTPSEEDLWFALRVCVIGRSELHAEFGCRVA